MVWSWLNLFGGDIFLVADFASIHPSLFGSPPCFTFDRLHQFSTVVSFLLRLVSVVFLSRRFSVSLHPLWLILLILIYSRLKFKTMQRRRQPQQQQQCDMNIRERIQYTYWLAICARSLSIVTRFFFFVLPPSSVHICVFRLCFWLPRIAHGTIIRD